MARSLMAAGMEMDKAIRAAGYASRNAYHRAARKTDEERDLMPVEDVMEMRPCAFDTVSRLTLADDTFREYDADAWEDDET